MSSESSALCMAHEIFGVYSEDKDKDSKNLRRRYLAQIPPDDLKRGENQNVILVMNTHSSTPLNSLPLVRSRLGGLAWFLVLFFAGIGALCVSLPFLFPSRPEQQDNGDIVFILVGGLLFLLLSLLGIFYLLYTEIRATEEGLCWRTWRGWKSARWDEVTDFYEKRIEKANIIETPAGNITIQNEIWTNWKPLREIVARRANKALNSEWAERGARQQERWPLVFDYDTPDNRYAGRFFTLMGLMLLVAFVILMTEPGPRAARNVPELGGLFLVISLLTALGIRIAYNTQRQAIRERGQQRITATSDGVTFEDGQNRLYFAWEDISLVYKEAGGGLSSFARYIVVGMKGQFDYTAALRDGPMLSLLLTHRAPKAVEQGLDFQTDVEDLGNQENLTGIGEHIYHYRTRSNRMLVWMAAMPALAGVLMVWMHLRGWTVRENNYEAWILAILFTIPALWAWWRYRAASIRTDATGITQYGLFGKRFVAWNDVRDYWRKSPDAPFTARPKRGRFEKIRSKTGEE
jgi:hypothetical protein